MNQNPRVFLNKKEDEEIKQGFPWVFDNEIAFLKEPRKDKNGIEHIDDIKLSDSTVSDGSLVEVISKNGLFLGYGIINKKSKITVRIMRRDKVQNENPFSKGFFQQKIQDAINIRYDFYKKEDSYRLIFGEADFLPGLIVERYVNTNAKIFLVVQFLALCTDMYRSLILDILKEKCHPTAIYEKDNMPVREKEGLQQQSSWIYGKKSDIPENGIIIIEENSIKIEVDITNGQKTGYFLDQKFNRARVAQLASNKRVLDAFTHTGAFGLNAFKGGAKEVISVDISQDAVDLVNRNIQQNNAQDKMTTICADVFDLLKKYENNKEQFDMIILDPPAFAKNAKAVPKAYGGYKEINLRAMRLLKKGGILITCSCSMFFDEQKFYAMIMHAAMDTHKSVQILEKNGAGPDHPVLCGYSKSEYLKCAICKVL